MGLILQTEEYKIHDLEWWWSIENTQTSTHPDEKDLKTTEKGTQETSEIQRKDLTYVCVTECPKVEEKKLLAKTFTKLMKDTTLYPEQGYKL